MNNNHNYLEEENSIIRKRFNLEYVLEFQLRHDIQIIRGEDYQYLCWIDKVPYGTSLTPLMALIAGIDSYNKKHEQ